MTKLFVGGLPYSIDSQKLKDMFLQFGEVLTANVITDKYTSQSKGFGFVEMQDDDAAKEAIKKLDGSDLEGRRLGVSVARPREDRPRGNSGFGGGRDNNRGFDRDSNRNFYKRVRR